MESIYNLKTLLLVTSVFILPYLGFCQRARTGDVRLVNRTSTAASSGRLEYYKNSDWGTVCSLGFHLYEADVPCRQLGYRYASDATIISDSENMYSPGLPSQPIWLSNVSCSTAATRLSSCSFISGLNCSHSDDIAVTCTNTSSPVRLVSKSGTFANLTTGRLEIFIYGEWGTVCDDHFTTPDADVACRQLGFENSYHYSNALRERYSILSSSIVIWLDDLRCSSSSVNNNDLRLCPHGGVNGHNCDHREDVILFCTPGNNLLAVIGGAVSAGMVGIFILIIIFTSIICVVKAKKARRGQHSHTRNPVDINTANTPPAPEIQHNMYSMQPQAYSLSQYPHGAVYNAPLGYTSQGPPPAYNTPYLDQHLKNRVAFDEGIDAITSSTHSAMGQQEGVVVWHNTQF